MGRFDNFGDYMFYLLFGPLKKGKKAINQFYIFFKVVGKIFDEMKAEIFRVRRESMIETASPVMLPVHGADRDMPRLEGEDIEAYRKRLLMKGTIARAAGTRPGILYALASIGYEQSYIEPMYQEDPTRWAEFIVFLRGKAQSGINDLRVIDSEVMKVKEGSSLPSYGMDAGNVVQVRSEFQQGTTRYPLCGTIVCGVFPHTVSVGDLVDSTVAVQSACVPGNVNYPYAGRVAVSKEIYRAYNYSAYSEIASDVQIDESTGSGTSKYSLCSSKTKLEKGGS
ncbi:MAG TPA: serine/arginine repetitive matrix protein 2 [Ruminiclostridium sp.]|nr:serine/arginine repetitive matrix protein 2 [Ruminiclostridium sp.]